MNRTLLLTAIFGLAMPTIFASAAAAKAPSQTVADNVTRININTRPEILGLWGMVIPNNNKCVEYYNFRERNEVIVNSGKEWSLGVYDYQPTTDPMRTKLPSLEILVKYENNEKDCSGSKQDQVGETSRVFVRWQDQNTIDFCSSENGDQCFVTLHRVRP